MKIIKLFLKTCKFIFIGILVLALLFNLTNIFKRLVLKEQMPLVLGLGTAVIITGSMEPAILPGDIVVIKEQSDYIVGDIVTYRGNSRPITHRIIEKTQGMFITQGDANNTDDGKIEQSRIIGQVIIVVPKVGHVILFFQSPLGILILMVGLFVIIEVSRFLGRNRKNQE